MKNVLRWVIIVCVIVSFGLFLKSTDIRESFALVKQLGTGAFWIFLVTFIAYIFGALGLKNCMNGGERLSLPLLFAVKHVGNIITVLNPSGAIAGEMYSADILIRQGIKKDDAYQSVILSRIVMILSQLVILLVVLVWFLFSMAGKLPPVLSYAFYGCFFAFLVVVTFLFWFLLKPGSENVFLKKEKKWHRILFKLTEMRNSLTDYIHLHPKKALKAYIFYTIHWLLASLELFIILNALGYDVDVFDSLFLDTFIVVSKSAVAFIPGQFGAEELLNRFALYLIRIGSSSLWLSVSVLRRARLLFWSLVAFILYFVLKRIPALSSSLSEQKEESPES